MNVVTYGTFDFFHEGHRRLLERARALLGAGGRLFVGVTTDEYDRLRGKLNVVQDYETRARQVRESGLADVVFAEAQPNQKPDDIRSYKIDAFVIGSDWLGKYDYLKEYCEVIYLPRTPGISSTAIRGAAPGILHGGIVACGRIANRFLPESRFVSDIVFDAVFHPRRAAAAEFAAHYEMCTAFDDFDAMLKEVDIVYVASPHLSHAQYVRAALEAGKHVLCEKPLSPDPAEAESLVALARERGLVLLEALKTAFAPGFTELLTRIPRGDIGTVQRIEAAFSKLETDRTLREFDPERAGGAWNELGSYVLAPIVKFLDANASIAKITATLEGGVEVESTAELSFANGATAKLAVDLTSRDRAELDIIGTRGRIHVAAPWWKPTSIDIFDHDDTLVEHIDAPFVADGLRYELAALVRAARGDHAAIAPWSPVDTINSLRLLAQLRIAAQA